LVSVQELSEETRRLYPGRQESFYDGTTGFPVYSAYTILSKKFKSLSSLKLCIPALKYKVSVLEEVVKETLDYIVSKEYHLNKVIYDGEKYVPVRYIPKDERELFSTDKQRLRDNAEILFTEIKLFIYEIFSKIGDDDFLFDDDLIPGFFQGLRKESALRSSLLDLSDMEDELIKYMEDIYNKLDGILEFTNLSREQLELAKKHLETNPIFEIDWMDKDAEKYTYVDCSFLREDMDNLPDFEKYDLFKVGYILNVHHKMVPETGPTHAVCVIKLYTPTRDGVQKYVFIDSNLRTLVTFDTQQQFKNYLVESYEIVYQRFISITSYRNPAKVISSSQAKFSRLVSKVKNIMSQFIKEKEKKETVDESELYGG
jgi:hypothetical protein